jgi:hypothetical protein
VLLVSAAAIGLAACGDQGPAAPAGLGSSSGSPSSSPTATAGGGGLTDLVRLTGQLSGRQAIDGSGQDHDGQALGTADGVVGAGTVADPFLSFTKPLCLDKTGCPLGVVVLDPSAKSIVPGDKGTAPFAFGATLRLPTVPSRHAGMNVIQRGLFGAGTAQWKLQADYGKPSCRWSDGTTSVVLPTKKSQPVPELAVGDWYDLRCERLAGDVFRLVVKDEDGADVYQAKTQSADFGAVLPEGPVLIGANSVSGESQEKSDQLHGDLRDVFFATTS